MLDPIDHTNKGRRTRGKAAEPKTVGNYHHTHNHAHMCTECQLREARRWRKGQAELRRGTDDRDQ